MAPSPDSAPQPFAELLTWLEQRAEYAYDPRELADIVWWAMERERLSPVVEGVPKAERTGAASADVVTIVDDTPAAPLSPPPPSEPVPAAPRASIVSQPTPELERQFGAPLPIALSAPSPLPNALALSRALYPLMRRVPSPSREYLDEDATVTQIADQRIKLPVMRPEPERWLELALVIEDTSILDIWQDTLTAFQKLLERHGAFRDVRTWYLQSEQGQLSLLRRRAAAAPQASSEASSRTRARSPNQIADATGRRLILFVSDCTSKLWQEGHLPQQLARWSETSPLALVQLLPANHWERSALGQGAPVWFSAQVPGTLSTSFQREGLRPRQLQRLRGEDKDNPRTLFNLPIITLDDQPLRSWAKVLSGDSEAETAGVVLSLAPPSRAPSSSLAPSPVRTNSSSSQPQPAPLTPQQRVARFWATASPAARRLAGMMAAQPVSLPVARLIQKELLKDQCPALLAEIFLSGLIRATQPDPTAQPLAANTWSYDFLPEVRTLLLKATALSTTAETRALVMESVKAKLPPEAQRQIEQQVAQERQRISAAIESELGLSSRQFEAFVVPALLKDWWESQDGGEAQLGEIIISLASLSEPALRAMGGPYAVLADQLSTISSVRTNQPSSRPAPQPEPAQPAPPIQFQPLEVETAQLVEIEAATPWPPLQTETVTVVTVTFQDSGLERFAFTTATITQQRQGFLSGLLNRQQSQWLIQKQQGAAYRFVEQLPQEVSLEMVQLSAGSFLMGSSPDEPERFDNEGPQHEVTVSAFFLGRYPITQAQWRAVAALEPVESELDPDPSRFKGEDRPVEKVSWQDVREFCQRLSRHTGRPYRLPSEAEWEYACRAGTTTPFHFGEMLTTDLANYNGKYAYANGPKGKDRSETTKVDAFPANAWGPSDLHGNVWEWCQDHYHKSYEGAPNDGTAWIDEDAATEEARILRGGSWVDYPRFCRSALRFRYDPSFRLSSFGFRVACAAPR